MRSPRRLHNTSHHRDIVLSATQLRARYILALSLIALLTICSQVVVQYLIADQEHDSRVVNIAGRQRMLSQKLAKLSHYYPDAGQAEEAQHWRRELGESLALWERSHNGLLHGDPELELPGLNSPEVIGLFNAIQPHFEAIAAASRQLLVASSPPADPGPSVRNIASHEAAFLAGMNDIVFRYDLEARRKVEFARRVEIGLMVLTLLVLVLEAAFIFAPAARHIRRDAQELADKEARLRATLDSSLDALISIDAAGKIIDFNPSAESTFGWKKEELLGRLMSEVLVPTQHRSAHDGGLNRFVTTREKRIIDKRIEVSALHRDGHQFPVELTVTAIRQGSVDMFTAYIRDLTERKKAEESLALAASVFTHAHEAIAISSPDGVFVDVNDQFCRVTGYRREEIVGQNPRLLKSGRQKPEFYAAMWRDLIDKGEWNGEIWNRRKNGEVFAELLTISAVRDRAGNTSHYVSLFSDITERKRIEDEMSRMAFHDPLTKLPNRRLIGDRLAQLMATTKRTGCYGAVMFLDLDNFKPLNDLHGHEIGDQLLIEVATRLRGCIREMDTVGRFGGDEFVVMLGELNSSKDSSAKQAAVVAEKVRSALAAPYFLQARPEGQAERMIEHRCTTSIGVALFIDHESTQDEILNTADAAMYRAKSDGRNRVCFEGLAGQDRSEESCID